MARELLPERLPEDVEAERSLLSTLCGPGMERRALDLMPRLEADHFVHPTHKALLGVLRALVTAGTEVNALTLKAEAERQKCLASLGGFGGIVDLLAAEEVGRPEVLAGLLDRKLSQRRLIRIGADLIRRAQDDDEDVNELADAAASDLFKLRRAAGQDEEAPSLRERALRFMETGQPLLTRDQGRNLVVFGVPHLDESVVCTPGTFGVVAARPSCGKSTFMLQAFLHSPDSAFLSLEMGEEEVDAALIAPLAGRSRTEVLKRGAPAAEMAEHLQAVEERLGHLREPARLCRWRNPTPEVVLATMRRMAMRGRRVFILDYFQLLRVVVQRGENLAYAMTRVTRDMKLLARELKVAVVVASQFNREVADGQRPELQHLRDSSGLEADTDWALMLWTAKARYEEGEDREVNWELQKNRGGARWCRGRMSFSPRLGRFVELTRETAPADAQEQAAAKARF